MVKVLYRQNMEFLDCFKSDSGVWGPRPLGWIATEPTLSSKTPNPLTSHIGQHELWGTKAILHLSSSLCLLPWQPHSLPWEPQPSSASALATHPAETQEQELCLPQEQDIWWGTPSLVHPPAAWTVKFHNDWNGLCLHQTHSIKGLKLLNNACYKYLEMLFGVDRELGI